MDYRYLINELDPTKYSDLINTLNHKKITKKERIIKNYKTKRNKKYKTKRNKKYKTINKRT